MRFLSLLVRALAALPVLFGLHACSEETTGRAALAQGCSLNSDCAGALVCTFKRCHTPCVETRDCPSRERCVKSEGVSSCQLTDDRSCVLTSDCPPPLVCATDSQCRSECNTPRDCATSQVCAQGHVCADPEETDSSGRLIVGDAAAGAGGSAGTGGATGTGGRGAGALDAAAERSDSTTSMDASETGDGRPPPTEICNNGTDDDHDGDIDCADSECTDYACSLPIPIGFTGPVLYVESAPGAEPSCPLPFDVELVSGHFGIVFDPAQCPCTCARPTGGSCTGVSVFFNPTTTCPNGNQSIATTGNCQAPPGGMPNAVTFPIIGGGSIQVNGSCTAQPGQPVLPGPTWTTAGRACAPAFAYQGGCTQGTVCAPKPTATFAKSCVFREGDVQCPTSGYTEKTVLHSGYDESRGCGTCTCGGVQNPKCKETVDLYSDNGCATAVDTIGPGDNCKAVSNIRSLRFTPQLLDAGTCNATRTPTGTCTPNTPTTVCCAK